MNGIVRCNARFVNLEISEFYQRNSRDVEGIIMDYSSLDIKKVVIFALMFIAGFLWLTSELHLDAATVIALSLFFGACGFFIFPRSGGRKHRAFIPRHKQYDESLYSDFIMERILKAYEGEARDSTPKSLAKSTETIEEKQIEKKINEEAVDEPTDEEQEEEIAEDVDGEEVDGDDGEEELEPRHYNDSRLTDYVMAKIMKAYNVEEEEEEVDDTEEETDDSNDENVTEEDEEADDNDDENVTEEDEEQEELEEENNEEIDEEIENTIQPTLYEEHASQEKVTGLKSYFTPVQLPITLAILWFFVPAIMKEAVPDINERIPKPFSMGTITFFPILFLVGLNGLLGILLKPMSDNLETTGEEKRSYILNILKILICWGIDIYVLLKVF
jgi:hypothetical protein